MLITLIANALINLFNFDLEGAKRLAKWILYGTAAFVLFIVIVVITKNCGGDSKPPLTEKERQEVNQAIDANNREQMEKAFVEVETKQDRIAANVSNSNAEAFSAIEKAKREVKEMSDAELAAHLESLK